MEEIKNNEEEYHFDLCNYCQRHKCSSKCLRKNKKTKQIQCRHDFPKKHFEKTDVLVVPYSRNKENNDVYYKVEIKSRRNDRWINEFFKPFLDHWQVVFFFYSL